jgi:hypothetical protein
MPRIGDTHHSAVPDDRHCVLDAVVGAVQKGGGSSVVMGPRVAGGSSVVMGPRAGGTVV